MDESDQSFFCRNSKLLGLFVSRVEDLRRFSDRHTGSEICGNCVSQTEKLLLSQSALDEETTSL